MNIKSAFSKFKEPILYIFFGVCTTLINTACYALLHDCLSVSNITSTILAWFAAVIFAFFTNRSLVFNSRSSTISEKLKEAASFFSCRALTGVLDVVIMFISVDILHFNSIVWKLISNIIVTIVNYVASKFFIFKKSAE